MERHHWAKVAAVFLVIRSDLGERMLHDTLRLDELHYFPHGPLVRCELESIGDIVDSHYPSLSNCVEFAEKPHRATVLAEPFSGTVTQGVVLVLVIVNSRL